MPILPKRYSWLFFLPLAGVGASTGPQGATISGYVTDNHKEPLQGVTVVMKHLPTGTFRGAITQSDGHYVLRNLRPGGPYSILLSMTGFKSQSRDSLRLKDGQKLVMDFRMQGNY
jgi:hypothetical protein